MVRSVIVILYMTAAIVAAIPKHPATEPAETVNPSEDPVPAAVDVVNPVQIQSEDDIEYREVEKIFPVTYSHISRVLHRFPSSNIHARGAQHYTLGSRTDGDTLIYASQNNYDWRVAQDASAEVRYPSEGNGDAYISQIIINVEQSDASEGQAYILDGGIGERFAELQILARKTMNFRYQILIYGIEV